MSFDVFSVAGITHDEDGYTQLLSWALNPNAGTEAASVIQSAWLRRLGIITGAAAVKAAAPQIRPRTTAGIPDLVLEYETFALVVEAKTVTDEHAAAQSDTPQTQAYPAAVRRLLRHPELPVHMVYLTYDGRAAANPDAICTTFTEAALALAEGATAARLRGTPRHALKLVVTHFLCHAAPTGVDVSSAIDSLMGRRAARGVPANLSREIRVSISYALRLLLRS